MASGEPFARPGGTSRPGAAECRLQRRGPRRDARGHAPEGGRSGDSESPKSRAARTVGSHLLRQCLCSARLHRPRTAPGRRAGPQTPPPWWTRAPSLVDQMSASGSPAPAGRRGRLEPPRPRARQRLQPPLSQLLCAPRRRTGTAIGVRAVRWRPRTRRWPSPQARRVPPLETGAPPTQGTTRSATRRAPAGGGGRKATELPQPHLPGPSSGAPQRLHALETGPPPPSLPGPGSPACRHPRKHRVGTPTAARTSNGPLGEGHVRATGPLAPLTQPRLSEVGPVWVGPQQRPSTGSPTTV
jgi:hypothetical protein